MKQEKSKQSAIFQEDQIIAFLLRKEPSLNELQANSPLIIDPYCGMDIRDLHDLIAAVLLRLQQPM